jgi:hypothetical protein
MILHAFRQRGWTTFTCRYPNWQNQWRGEAIRVPNDRIGFGSTPRSGSSSLALHLLLNLCRAHVSPPPCAPALACMLRGRLLWTRCLRGPMSPWKVQAMLRPLLSRACLFRAKKEDDHVITHQSWHRVSVTTRAQINDQRGNAPS